VRAIPARTLAHLWYAITTVVVALVLLVLWPDEVGAALALVVLSAALVLASALFPPGSDRRDFGDVLFLVGLPFLLGFGLWTLLSLGHFVPINAAGVVAADPFQFTFDEVSLRALTLAVISWGVLTAGYRLRIGEKLAARLPDPSLARVDSGSVRVATVVVAIVGWSARITAMLQGGVVDVSFGIESINAFSTLLAWLSFLTTVASTLALFAVFFRQADSPGVLLAVGLVSAEMITGFITGSRTLIFTPLIGTAAMAYLTGRYHLRLRHLLIVPALLLVIGVTDTYRNPGLVSNSTVDLADVGARIETVIEESVDQGPVQLASRGTVNVALRYHGLYSVAQILRVGPPSELSYGYPYLMAVPTALVPRFVWPDKPFPTLGVDFGRRYFGLPDSSNVSIAPTWLGDLILNVPLFLAPIGMGLLGILLRCFRGYGMRGRGGTTFSVLAFPILLPIVIPSDGWISGGVWEATRAIAVLAVVTWLLRRLAPRGEVRAPRGSAAVAHIRTSVAQPVSALAGPEDE
jgi:hypothetical protein